MADRLMSEAEGYRLLAKYGIPVPKHAVARNADSAAALADEIGYPVVMKAISDRIVHKSDAGGVITSIENGTTARTAFMAIMANIKAFDPAATIEGVIVEQQLEKGLEMIIGGKTDPTFGKVLTI